MKVLHEIMRDPTLGMDVSLGCVRTGCLLLSGQTGMALNIDVKVGRASCAVGLNVSCLLCNARL